jgi:aspartate aminotransferase-like enzyme
MTLTKIAQQNLRTPGPTPIPDDIMEEMSLPMINHRGPEFKELIEATTDGLKQVFMTANDLYILTASGTGALESSVVNTLSPGDRVIACTAGSFGDRYVQIAQTYGADVLRMDFEWGDAIDPEAIRAELRKDPSIKAVLVTHNETSTGVTHDLEAISRIVKSEFDKLLLVDAVSSLGCIPLPVDAWDCDLVGTASQKGFMIPPGLAFISVSERAWEAQKSATMPRFYFDLEEAKKTLERGQTPFTPNVAAMYGLSLGLDKILDEGLEGVFGRHASIGQLTRDRIRELGLELLVSDERYASNTVTAVKMPEGIDGRALMGRLRTEKNVVLAGGQGKLSTSIFRIGHLGHVTEDDIEEVIEALRELLPEVGFSAN